MSAGRRTRRLRWAADDGITLAELLVSMVVMSMVVLATVTLTTGMQRTDASTWGRSDDTTAAQYAMRVISRSVPYAVRPAVFASVMDSSVLVAADDRLDLVIRDPDATWTSGGATAEDLLLVELEIVDGVLTERRTALDDVADGDALLDLLPLSTGCTSRDCSTRVLVDGTQDGSGFVYLDQDGEETTSTGSVRAVEVTLVVLTEPQRQDVPSTHRQRIYLKND
jgi:hypothetical protein